MAYTPKSDDQPFDNGKCPTPEEVIDQYLKQKNPRIPDGMPSDGFQAARWWMARQAPGDRFTESASPPVKKGGTWTTPYHDRLIYTLKKFLKLKRVQQVFVIEHIEKGIPWRGDDMDKYTQYVEEHAKMLEDKEKYVDDGFKQMHKVLRGMQV